MPLGCAVVYHIISCFHLTYVKDALFLNSPMVDPTISRSSPLKEPHVDMVFPRAVHTGAVSRNSSTKSIKKYRILLIIMRFVKKVLKRIYHEHAHH